MEPSPPDKTHQADCRRRADFEPILPAEAKVLKCCRQGKVAVIGKSRPQRRTAENHIWGAFLRFLALGGDEDSVVHESGVRLKGAWIDLLVLDGCKVSWGLSFVDCHLEQIEALNAELFYLELDGSKLASRFEGSNLRCAAGLCLRNGFEAENEICLYGAEIGFLDCSNGRFASSNGKAIVASNSTIKGDVYLSDGFVAEASVDLNGAKIGNSLNCSRGSFSAPTGIAFYCQASIGRHAFLDDGLSINGEANLIGASIGGDLVLHGSIIGTTEFSINAESLSIGGNLIVNDGFYCENTICFSQANIGISIVLIGVDARGAEDSFVGDNMVVGRSITIYRSQFEGRISFMNAKVATDVAIKHSTLSGHPISLSFERATIGRSLFLTDDFIAAGEVNIVAIEIGLYLQCTGGQFQGGVISINADHITVGIAARFDGDFSSMSTIRLAAARIGQELIFDGGSFHSNGGYAIDMHRSKVGGVLFFRLVSLDGGIDLSWSSVGILCDDLSSWSGAAGRIDLEGFTYDRLADVAPGAANGRVDWLRMQEHRLINTSFRQQPWEQLASVYRRMGHFADARHVAIEKEKQLRRSGNILVGAKALHWFYGLTVGYGYRPYRLLIAMTLAWLFCAAIFHVARDAPHFGPYNRLIVPAEQVLCPGDESGSAETNAAKTKGGRFVPLVYSADVILPIVNLDYKDQWRIVLMDCQGKPLIWGETLQAIYWIEIALGWIAGILLVGVVGTLIKRD